jgi:hypothetical protein
LPIVDCADSDKQLLLYRKTKERPAIGSAIELVPGSGPRSGLVQPLLGSRQRVEPESSLALGKIIGSAPHHVIVSVDRRLVSRPPFLIQQSDGRPVHVHRQRAHDLQTSGEGLAAHAPQFAFLGTIHERQTRPVDRDIHEAFSSAADRRGRHRRLSHRRIRDGGVFQKSKSAFALRAGGENPRNSPAGRFRGARRHCHQSLRPP